MTVAAAVDAPLWLAAESADERAEREAGWHWAWGAEPADGRLRAFVWDFALDAPLPSARLLVAAQKGLPGVWLDGRPLQLHTFIRCSSGPKRGRYVRSNLDCDGTSSETQVSIRDGVVVASAGARLGRIGQDKAGDRFTLPL